MSTDIGAMIDSPLGPTRIGRYPVDFSEAYTHVLMLRNRPKYRLLSEALARVVRGKSVLDVGSGSGILALLCVAHGAKRVVAIDRRPVIRITRAVRERFRSASVIDIWEGDLFDIREKPERFDIIISETIGYLGFEENIGEILAYARTRFGRPNTIVIPEELSITLKPITNGNSNRSSTPYLAFNSPHARCCVRAATSAPIKLGARVDFPLIVSESWTAMSSMDMSGVAVYFDALLPNSRRLANEDDGCWPHCVLPFESVLRLKENVNVRFRLEFRPSKNGTYHISFRCYGDGDRFLLGQDFHSNEIQTNGLPDISATIDVVVNEVESNLRQLGVFEALA